MEIIYKNRGELLEILERDFNTFSKCKSLEFRKEGTEAIKFISLKDMESYLIRLILCLKTS